MTYLVAVSGGVDSVALLHMLVEQYGSGAPQQLIVAHFDHGIRPESSDDARFVQQLAARYGLRYEGGAARLGARASEATARDHRYAFLRDRADYYNAEIVTAHHLDDLVETIALNFSRGTGWRGVAVFGARIHRPLLAMTKDELVQYARQRGLLWREDSTNRSDKYLRNRLRRQTSALPDDTKRQLHALYAHQHALARELRDEVTQLVGGGPEYSRYLFSYMPTEAALECLRYITSALLTRPQLQRLLHAIKVAQPGSHYEAGTGVKVYFTTRQFSLKLIKL